MGFVCQVLAAVVLGAGGFVASGSAPPAPSTLAANTIATTTMPSHSGKMIRAAGWSCMKIILALVLATSVLAQDPDPHAACAAAPAYVPAELLEREVGLRAGIGNSHDAVTTTSPEAQAFYDQGLNYLESYVWIEAARSFHQALRHDPKLAMAYIGLSRTHSGLNDAEGAKRYYEKAKALAKDVSEKERRRIEIRGLQLAAMDDITNSQKHLEYKKAIDDALAADLDDPELWILRGNAEEANASGRGQRGTAASIAFYERALQLVPDHATAHHFLIHSCETIGKIDKALKHGEVYARLAPSVPHAAHMWAHDLRRVGRVDDAIVQFVKANRLERAYYEAEHIDPALDWHHGHNLNLLAQSYQHKGQLKLAETTMRAAEALGAPEAYQAFNLREIPSFLIQRGRYDDALESARRMIATSFPQARAAGHALAGEALVRLGRMDAAREELAAAQRELELVPRVVAGVSPSRTTVEPWVNALRGELLLRGDNPAEGRDILTKAIRALRAIPGPDAWTQALFRIESTARSAREAGDWTLAEFAASQMLEHDSAYGGSHLAMALVLEHKGDAAGARAAMENARNLWPDADSDLVRGAGGPPAVSRPARPQ